MVQSFKYNRHLVGGNEIRVLWLFPGNAASPLKATIQYYTLGTNPEYQALSYTWENPFNQNPSGLGMRLPDDQALSSTWESPFNRDDPSRGYKEPKREQSLWINDCVLKITQNLYSALQHLRHPQDTLTLWIDAVCIDQRHNEEKSWQIQQMRRIYEQASRVIIWLGPAASNSTLAMDTLESMCRWQIRSSPYLKRAGNSMVQVPEPQTDQEYYDQLNAASFGRLFGKPVQSDFEIPPYPIEAVANLLNRAYWGRGWCWQEFAVAKDVIIACGNRTIENGDICLNVFTETWDRLGKELGRQPRALDHRPWAMLELRRAHKNVTDLEKLGFEDDPTITPPFSLSEFKIWVYQNVRSTLYLGMCLATGSHKANAMTTAWVDQGRPKSAFPRRYKSLIYERTSTRVQQFLVRNGSAS